MVKNIYTEQPCSTELLEALFNVISNYSYKNSNATFFSFRGSGLLSEISYLVYTNRHNKKDQLFSLIDLSTQIAKGSLLGPISYLYSRFGDVLTDYAKKDISKSLESPLINEIILKNLIHKLTFTHNYTITFIIDEAGLLYAPSYARYNLDRVISDLKAINPMKINFIFLAEYGFSEKKDLYNENIGDIFNQNIFWGNDYLFDNKSAKYLFDNQSKWHKFKFDPDFVKKATEIAIGDPTLLKRIAQLAISEDDFVDKFKTTTESKNLFNLINDEDWLRHRYQKILRNLDEKSLVYLAGDHSDDATEFIVGTGLLTSSKKPYSQLFDYYLANFREDINDIVKAVNNSASIINDTFDHYENFSGQEMLVYRYLETAKGKIVSKEKIAEIIWGREWEQKYSDWALDKLISRLRKKVVALDIPEKIRVIKGKGIILE